MPRVAILDDLHHAWEQTDGVRRMRERAEVTVFTRKVTPAELQGFDILVANRERTTFTRELFQQLPAVKAIVQTGNHANHLDFAAAAEANVVVAQASAGYSIGAAELVFGLAQAVMRQIPANDAAVRRGEWPVPSTPVLHGKTLGIVGLGRVGQHVAGIARGFGMRVLAWSRSLTPDGAAAAGAERRELDDLLRESDVVTLHASLSPTSRGLIDARRLGLMKPTAFLVNTARGPLVDEAALVTALRERTIAGAGLDVFDAEPLSKDHPLLALPNVVLTPHIGWPTDDGYQRFAAVAADVLIDYLDGKDVPHFEGH